MSCRGAILALTLLGAAGCAATAPQVRVDRADVDLAKCRTFAWLPAAEEAASLTEQRVRAAVMQELEKKGYSAAGEQRPDCRITYILAVHERAPQKPRIGVGAGGGSGGVRGGVGVSFPIGRTNPYAGEFTLDVIDAASNVQIWSGSLDASLRASELSEAEATELVSAVLAEYPDRSRAGRREPDKTQ